MGGMWPSLLPQPRRRHGIFPRRLGGRAWAAPDGDQGGAAGVFFLRCAAAGCVWFRPRTMR
eukprot:624444-Pyramimonas_sp.AAC.1